MSTQPKSWKEVPLGGACWRSSTEYKTGDWRSYKPIWNIEKCTRCMFCHIYCPEGAIKHDTETNKMVFDYDFCKGCGICANECPATAIEMVLEGKE
jgi:pyruvate ferredoxin oxidoreductase delta subunit